MLSITKVELDLISDVDMYLFFEKVMRDGLSYISEWYSKANNKYLLSYDPYKTDKIYHKLGQKLLTQLC